MDPTQLTHISLCAGYGGIDLGLRRVLPDLRTIAYSEIEEYACGLLAARMESGHLDPAPIWSDLKTFPFREFHGCVDILSGGYPCQPFSAAGKRRGTDDPRHLWPYIADGIRLCQPSLCFFENVEGHISLGLRDVLGDLERLGYAATWGIFSAAEIGAPHQRKRIFILAHRCGAGLERYLRDVHDSGWESAGQAGSIGQGDLPRVADAEFGQRCPSVWPSRPGEPQHAWEPPRVVGNAEGEQAGGVQLAKVSSDAASASPSPMGDATGGTRLGTASGPAGHAALADQSVANAHRRGLEWAGAQRGRTEDAIRSNRESSEVVADPSLLNRQRGTARTGRRSGSEINAAARDAEQQRETESPVGGNPDGAAGRLDYADLSIACHNRTDELRLLGNGVVPATAERAFRTLYARLFP